MLEEFKYKVGFIGGGNMANAIINGLVSGGVVEANRILVSDPNLSIVEQKVAMTAVNDEAFNNCEFLVLSIKPQVFNLIKNDFAGIKAKYVISIMAGIGSSAIMTVAPKHTQVIRVMPNTPCKVGAGMVCIAARNDTDNYAKAFVESMFRAIAEVEYVDESLFDAVTSISGSGPAYALMFINSLIKSGVEGGLPYDTAKKLAINTVYGSAKMALKDDGATSIDSMIDAVCSKGGTTIEAVNVFNSMGLDNIVSAAVAACRNRSIELSKG